MNILKLWIPQFCLFNSRDNGSDSSDPMFLIYTQKKLLVGK